MTQSFTISSLNCAPLTTAVELCRNIEAVGADIWCLQNCVESKLSALPSCLARKSMSGSTIVVRDGVFAIEQLTAVNLLEEVLRRTDSIPAYADALPLSFCNLLNHSVGMVIALLRHVPTSHTVIVVTGDVTLPSRLCGVAASVGELTSSLRGALCAEMQRVLWRVTKPGVCAAWGCRRVIVAGGLVGCAHTAAYHMLHRPPPCYPMTGGGVSHEAVAVSSVCRSPFSASSSSSVEQYTCTFTLPSTATAMGVDGIVAGFSLPTLCVDAAFFEIGVKDSIDGTTPGYEAPVSFRHVDAMRDPGEGGRQWRVTGPVAFAFTQVSLVRATWVPSDECANLPGTRRCCSTQCPVLNVILRYGAETSSSGQLGLDGSTAPCPAAMRSALASSLSAAEVEEDIGILQDKYAQDAAASTALAAHLRLRTGTGSNAAAALGGEPVASVSDFDAKQRSLGTGKSSVADFRTGCQNFIFYTYQDGLQLVEAKQLRARDVLTPSATIHKPVTCTLAFTAPSPSANGH